MVSFGWIKKGNTEFASGESSVGVSHYRYGGYSRNWSWWCIQVEVTGGGLVMSWRRVTQQLLHYWSSRTWCLYVTCSKEKNTECCFSLITQAIVMRLVHHRDALQHSLLKYYVKWVSLKHNLHICCFLPLIGVAFQRTTTRDEFLYRRWCLINNNWVNKLLPQGSCQNKRYTLYYTQSWECSWKVTTSGTISGLHLFGHGTSWLYTDLIWGKVVQRKLKQHKKINNKKIMHLHIHCNIVPEYNRALSSTVQNLIAWTS